MSIVVINTKIVSTAIVSTMTVSTTTVRNTQIKFWISKITSSLLLLVLWLASFFMVLELTISLAVANYEDKTGLTNINKVDPLFKKNIENFSEFKASIESQKNSAVGSINNKEGMKFLPDSERKAKAEADRLGKIEATDLESRGRREFNKNPDLNDLFIDYSKPGMMAHKQDAAVIANGTDKLLGNLLGHLKELGIDCGSVKGDKIIEPEYFVETEKSLLTREKSKKQFSKDHEDKDTIYNQHFCEQLRNQYNCSNSLGLSCKVPGIEWGPWQDKQIRVPGGELVGFGKHIFHIDKTARGCFEYKLRAGTSRGRFGLGPPKPPEHRVIQGLREFLAIKHNAPSIDSIDTQMSSSWEGGIFSINGWTYDNRILGCKDYAWAVYIINYRYREGKPVCALWAEEWTEQCRLN